MDDRDFDRRSENRVVHYKKINSICQKTGIVSRGIELSSIVELQNIEKYSENYLCEADPSFWLKRVIELRGQIKYKEALDLINLVLKVKPKLKEAHYIKGEILRYSGLKWGTKQYYLNAIESYNKALDLEQTDFYVLDEDPKEIDYDIHQHIAGCFIDISDYENAIRASENAILLFPDRWGGWEIKADCFYFHLAKYDAAIYYYDKAINILKKAISNNNYLGPLDDYQNGYFRIRLADDLIYKGICLKRLGRFDAAIETYKEALELNPNRYRAWEYIGLALVEQGKNEEANQYYKKEITNSKWAYQAWHNLSSSLTEMGKFEEALNAVNEGLKIKPDYDLLFDSKVRILTNLKRYDEALVTIDEYIKLNPKDAGALKRKAELWHNKGISFSNLNRYEEAIAAFDRALVIDPNLSDAWFRKGVEFDNLKRYEEAIKAFDRALAIDPNFSYAWGCQGTAFYNLKLYEKAIAAYDRALDIDPTIASIWNNRGGALFNLNCYKEAIMAFDRALAIDPKFTSAWNNKGHSLKALNLYEEANEAYKRALDIDPNILTGR